MVAFEPRVYAPTRLACVFAQHIYCMALVYAIARRPNNCLVRERQAGSRLLHIYASLRTTA
jgi:hypothetical protein